MHRVQTVMLCNSLLSTWKINSYCCWFRLGDFFMTPRRCVIARPSRPRRWPPRFRLATSAQVWLCRRDVETGARETAGVVAEARSAEALARAALKRAADRLSRTQATRTGAQSLVAGPLPIGVRLGQPKRPGQPQAEHRPEPLLDHAQTGWNDW